MIPGHSSTISNNSASIFSMLSYKLEYSLVVHVPRAEHEHAAMTRLAAVVQYDARWQLQAGRGVML